MPDRLPQATDPHVPGPSRMIARRMVRYCRCGAPWPCPRSYEGRWQALKDWLEAEIRTLAGDGDLGKTDRRVTYAAGKLLGLRLTLDHMDEMTDIGEVRWLTVNQRTRSSSRSWRIICGYCSTCSTRSRRRETVMPDAQQALEAWRRAFYNRRVLNRFLYWRCPCHREECRHVG